MIRTVFCSKRDGPSWPSSWPFFQPIVPLCIGFFCCFFSGRMACRTVQHLCGLFIWICWFPFATASRCVRTPGACQPGHRKKKNSSSSHCFFVCVCVCLLRPHTENGALLIVFTCLFFFFESDANADYLMMPIVVLVEDERNPFSCVPPISLSITSHFGFAFHNAYVD